MDTGGRRLGLGDGCVEDAGRIVSLFPISLGWGGRLSLRTGLDGGLVARERNEVATWESAYFPTELWSVVSGGRETPARVQPETSDGSDGQSIALGTFADAAGLAACLESVVGACCISRPTRRA